MIKELKELIMVVDQGHPDVSALLGSNGKTNTSKLRRLYEGIAQGEYHSDDDAAAKLYPEEGGNKSTYRKLKFTLREKLINSLFNLDLKSSELNEYQKAYYDCHKQWAATKILLGKNANIAAVNVSLKLFKLAERFEFTAMSMDIASMLRLHYSIREGDREKYHLYSDYFDRYTELYLQENHAERLYLDLSINQVNSREIKESTIQEAEKSFALIESILAQYDSYRLNLYAALILLTYYEAKKDYHAALATCKRFITYFLNKDYEAHVPLQILYYQELVCSFQLRLFSERAQLAQRCQQYLRAGTYNWFKYQELLLQMAMYEGDYPQAWQIYQQTTTNPRFTFLPENITEVWTIIKAYFYFLVKTDQLQVNLKKLQLDGFRARKFGNETILYAKDKKGLNIAIQIVQYLIVLAEGKLNQAIDHVEAIEQYAYRHLRRADTMRSRLFIKMMIQIPQCSFEVDEFIKKSTPYLQQLKTLPAQEAASQTEIEILPYEAVWDILCRFFGAR